MEKVCCDLGRYVRWAKEEAGYNHVILVGGSGGGRPDLAEAGGKDTAGLKSALSSVPSMVEALL